MKTLIHTQFGDTLPVIDLIGPAYANLRTRKREKTTEAALAIEREMQFLKDEFDALIYRAIDEDPKRNNPSRLARVMGASRSTVYEIIKRRPSTPEPLIVDPLAEFIQHTTDNAGEHIWVTVNGETHEVTANGEIVFTYHQGPSGQAWDQLPDKPSQEWKTWLEENWGDK